VPLPKDETSSYDYYSNNWIFCVEY
jgi:hypothetical protein